MHITNLISRTFGKFAKKEFPPFIQNIINTGYVKFLRLDMSEFKNPKEYKTLNMLFTRQLEVIRPYDENSTNIISPADSLVSQCGNIANETLLQIKGMEYNVEELLTYFCKDNFPKIKDGNYMNFYLSPKDYHRYHAIADCKIKKLIHVPGKLYPVNMRYLNKELDLFVQNERVILECIHNGKYFYMVFVGALNVGQMVFNFETRVETNKKSNEIKIYEYDNLEIKKADCLGYFKMGSTVVLIWEKDCVILDDLINDEVKYGQKIASYIE